MMASFSSELMKLAGAKEYARDLAAGVDPFGAWTGASAQKAEREGASAKRHRKKRLIGTAGGVVGGALVVPSAIHGVIDAGTSAATAGKGRRLRAAGKGFVRGLKTPVRGLTHATRATRLLRKAEKAPKGIKLTAKHKKSLEFITENTPLGAVQKGLNATGASPALRKKLDTPGELVQATRKAQRFVEELRGGHLSRETARAVAPSARQTTGQVVSGLGLGGGVGGLGAYVQYGKGRATEKRFQERLRAGEKAKK